MFDSDAVTVTSTTGKLWVLNEPLTYRGRRDTFQVPAGFGTDFATIPQPLHWLVGRTGAHTRAVVLHDWLVTDGIATGQVTDRDADGLFRRVLRETGVPFILRWVMWCGVRYGALTGGRRHAWHRDLPLVALISLLALPLILVPTVTGALGLGLYRLVETIAGWPVRARRRWHHRRDRAAHLQQVEDWIAEQEAAGNPVHLCRHTPHCARYDRTYCWPPEYIASLVEHFERERLDPVRLAAVRGPGLAARTSEYMQSRAAAERRLAATAPAPTSEDTAQ